MIAIKHFYLIAATLVMLSCSENDQGNIYVTIEGLKNQNAIIAFVPEKNSEAETIDTIQFTNGVFDYNFPAKERYEVIIIPLDLIYEFQNGRAYPTEASRIHFFIDEKNQIKIKAKIHDEVIDFVSTGNSLSEHESKFRKKIIPTLKKNLQLQKEINATNPPKRNFDSLLYALIIERWHAQVDYALTKPDLEYSAKLLLGANLKERVSKAYQKLDDKAIESYYGRLLKSRIESELIKQIGAKFPEIQDQTLSGKNWKLSNHKGKYVLIDFWGTWCAPCIAEIPTLRDLEITFDSDLEIIGIACKDTREDVINFQKEHYINWDNILEPNSGLDRYSVRFGIQSYPTKFLLNREGAILKIYHGLDKDFDSDIRAIINN